MQTYYDVLTTDEEKYAYAQVRDALEQKASYAAAQCGSSAGFVYEAVITDNPLLCISHPWFECVYDGRNFAFEYINVDESVFNTQLDKLVEDIRKKYEEGGETSTYALYRTVFEVLSKRITYDAKVQDDFFKLRSAHKSAAEMQADISRFFRRYGKSFSPYGALVERKAVCNGIAKLYKIVCDRFSLPCACVQACDINTFKKPPTEISDTTVCDHLLNVIEIDGQLAYVDLTNGLATENLPMTRYDLFAVNYDVLKKLYLVRPRDLALFNCNGVDNLYYQKNKLVFPTLGSFRRYAVSFISKFKNGEVRMYYKGKHLSDDELIDILWDILSSHCPPTKMPSEGISCHNGFISCAIVDRE